MKKLTITGWIWRFLLLLVLYIVITKEVIVDQMKMPFPHVGYKVDF